MWFVPVPAGLHAVDGGVLRGQHNLIYIALFRREPAVHRKAACDIGGVPVELGTGVDQQHVAALQLGVVLVVMQDTTVGAASDDCRIRRKLAAALLVFVPQFSLDLIFHLARLADLHGTAVRGGRNFRGTAHEPDLVGTLEEPHLVQHVVEIDELAGRVHTVACLGAHLIYPTHEMRIELGVAAHAVKHLFAILEQAGQDLVDVFNWKGVVRTIDFACAIETGTPPFPDFLFPIVLAAEQQELAMSSTRYQHRHGLGFRKVCEVIEIAVRPVGKEYIAVARTLWGGLDNGDTTTHVLH